MTPLLSAYLRWVSFKPVRDCCIEGHWASSGPIPDNEVCSRERAWREYVRIRDNNSGWMRDGWRGKSTYYQKSPSMEEVRLMFKKGVKTSD